MNSPRITRISTKEFFAKPKALELISLYSDECRIQGMPVPNPDKDLYQALEESGLYHFFEVLLNGDLVGFTGCMISPNPHYGVKIMSIESLYISPDARKAGVGTELIRELRKFSEELKVPLFLGGPRGSAMSKYLNILESKGECKNVYEVFYVPNRDPSPRDRATNAARGT